MAVISRMKQGTVVFKDWIVTECKEYSADGKTGVFRIVRSHQGWQEVSALKVVNILEEIGEKSNLSDSDKEEFDRERSILCKQAEQELYLMSRLRGNSQIMEYYDFMFADYQEENVFGTELLIRMEYLDNLQQEQKRNKRYSEQEIIQIGKDICNALMSCHQKGIIHRDIRPANIFVTPWGGYKLGDLRIAEAEQFASYQEKYDERVDTYSLGLTLYELVNSNKLPSVGHESAREKELPLLTEISPKLAKVIKKACAYKADERYSSVTEFYNALCNMETGNIPESNRKKTKYRMLGITCVIAMACIIMAVVLWARIKKDQPTFSEKIEQLNLPSHEAIQEEYNEIFGKAVYITSNQRNVAVINDKNELYIWGRNEYGQVGCGNLLSQAKPVPVLENVAMVDLSHFATAAVTRDGKLYVWGSNENWQIGADVEVQKTPLCVLDNVKEVQLGFTNSGALRKNGDLYCWGSRRGNGSEDHQRYPVKILSNVATFSLVDMQGAAVTENGELYMWGDNRYGQIAVGTEEQFTPILLMQDVKSVVVGDTTTAAIKTNGDLYMWGANDTGQVGVDSLSVIPADEPVFVLENVENVALERSYSAAITKAGKLYLWGANPYGQLGIKNSPDDYQMIYDSPKMVAEDVETVVLGGMYTGFIKNDGVLYLCGNNSHHEITKLGRDEVEEPLAVAEEIECVAFDIYHSYAVDKYGRFYQWGD